MAIESQELNVDQVRVLLQNSLSDIEDINILWKDIRRVHAKGYVFQLIVDRLSMGFLKKVEDIPLVKSVHFFPKVGTGQHGINLLFKLHIVFDKL
tara:strand:+ start:467 stop:751 length:285 start_codon:yes stop_codon:yes gene_type:complete